mgnify:CR=1 FL=1
MAQADAAGVPVRRLGHAGGETLQLADDISLTAQRLRDLHESFFPHLMGVE